jgi:uncharacterized membrane protein YdbT with pleckstrin-like domain
MSEGNIMHPDFQELHAHRGAPRFFPGQRDTEVLQLFIRKHWLAEAFIFLRFLILTIIFPAVVVTLLAYLGTLSENVWQIIYFGIGIYLLFAWLHTFIEFMKNELSALVVTNDRVIDFEMSSLFDHRISEANLDRIQDVIGRTHGVLGTFFDIGDIDIQTAGGELLFLAKMTKSPQFTARKVLNVQRQSLMRRRSVDHSATPANLKKRPGDNLSDEEILRLRGAGSTRRNSDARSSSNSSDGI